MLFITDIISADGLDTDRTPLGLFSKISVHGDAITIPDTPRVVVSLNQQHAIH